MSLRVFVVPLFIAFHVVFGLGCTGTAATGPRSTHEFLPLTVTLSPAVQLGAKRGPAHFTSTVHGTVESPPPTTDVIWSVQESGGGTVDSSGQYTAPTAPGTYHIVATSVAD